MKDKQTVESNKLTEAIISGWKEALEKVDKFESVISDRVDYIIQTIFKVFGKANIHWWFEDNDIDIMGDCVYVTVDPYTNAEVILKDGEWNLVDGFPTRWLTEDFEIELQEGKIKYIQKKEEKKLKASLSATKRKEEKEKLVKSAKEKLSKEERQALGLK